MFRVDAICDRIHFNSIEAENAVNNFKESSEKLRENFFCNLFKDFQTKETQLKIHKLINKPESYEELKIIFDVMDKHLDAERERKEKGMATHLLVLLLNNLDESEPLWRKMLAMIDQKDTFLLNKFLKRQSVMNKVSSVIENYLNSLFQVGDDFFIASEDDDSSSSKLFTSIEVSHMIIIIHHLLNLPTTSTFFYDKMFTVFELNESFISFLKLSLRNLSL